MAEQKRLESSVTPDAADRDGQAESLLVDGLDRYFSGRYEEAIHLWTRVLFIDRSHARARAYIDRARTAMAERQRRTEEMLHRTDELLGSGQLDQARVLLGQAVSIGADDERVAEMRSRIDRVTRARGHATVHTPAAIVDAIPLGRRQAMSRSRLAVMAVAIALALVLGALSSPLLEGWISERGDASGVQAAGATETFPVLSSSETALVRARTLYARGRLAEALRVLDRVDARSPQWSAADQLRVEIQQLLLASRRGLSSAAADAGRQ